MYSGSSTVIHFASPLRLESSPSCFSLLFTFTKRVRVSASAATQLIEEVTNRLDSLSLDAPTFILGDVNHCQVHKTVPGAFKSLTMPPFAASYHTSVLLVPISKPICRKQVCTEETVTCWTPDPVFHSSCPGASFITPCVGFT